MNSFFTELGRTVLAQWKKHNFSPARFPEIAAAALEKRPPAKHVDRDALVRDFLLEDEQAFQTQSGFGQPELVVYDDPRFYIQVLFWLEGTTDIHQHTFSGAFHVMEGSSIHSRFTFDDSQSISAHLRVGNLRMTSTHLLETGTTEPIISGDDYVHSLFHLDTPSLTVVVRTHNDPGTGPQFTYLPPHLAVDPFHQDSLTQRRKQLLDVLEQTEDAAYGEFATKMIEQLDFERGFFILQNCMGRLRQCDQWDEAWSAFESRHGKLAKYVAPTLNEIVRRDGLAAMRAEVIEPEHRFFLALLMNVPTRADLLAMVAQRFGGAPSKTILRWTEELMQSSDYGTSILDAVFPDELEIPPSKQAKVFLSALRTLLEEGKPSTKPAANSLSKAGMKLLCESLAHSSLRAFAVGED